MAIKTITIQELEESDKGSIWLINSAHKSHLDLMESEILINIPNAQGKPDMMKVPLSWLPFEATAKFPKKRVLESVEFRAAVLNELVTLIPEEEAARMMREPGAKEERARLRAREAHVRAAGAPRTISDANVDVTNPNELQNGVPVNVVGQDAVHQVKAGAQANGDGLKPNFVAFFGKVRTMADIDALNMIKNKGRFSRRELRYMRDNLPNHPKTVKSIKSRLIELKKEAAAQ